MPATIIMGGQWGDEGKGKLTDALATNAHVVVRANGGNNAGHTVTTSAGVFKLHLVPSGVLNPACTCVIGAGVVIDPLALVRELDGLIERGINVDNLVISDRAHIVMPYHPALDRAEESARGGSAVGTTLRGNGPAYADKVGRHGIRVADLIDPATLMKKLEREVAARNQILTKVYGADALDPVAMHRTLSEAGQRLAPYVTATEVVVQDALEAGKQVLVECAQGAMLDIDYGTYPFVTSSSPTASGACQGAGIAPTQIDKIVAVYKAYGTRVGSGPFPSELFDETGHTIRERGREYGTSTGRPRRTGWFDAVAGRSVARQNGITEICLTLVDVLDVFERIKVCTGYEINGKPATAMPAREDLYDAVKPIYTEVPGWLQDITAARSLDDLPGTAVDYVKFLESRLGAPISMIGVGPAREQLVPLTANSAISALV